LSSSLCTSQADCPSRPVPAVSFLIPRHSEPPRLAPFPTRRSSDLAPRDRERPLARRNRGFAPRERAFAIHGGQRIANALSRGAKDRKSTRLNSSHVSISYAVFCLKKKI